MCNAAQPTLLDKGCDAHGKLELNATGRPSSGRYVIKVIRPLPFLLYVVCATFAVEGALSSTPSCHTPACLLQLLTEGYQVCGSNAVGAVHYKALHATACPHCFDKQYSNKHRQECIDEPNRQE